MCIAVWLFVYDVCVKVFVFMICVHCGLMYLSSFQLDRLQVLWFGDVRAQILMRLGTSYVHS